MTSEYVHHTHNSRFRPKREIITSVQYVYIDRLEGVVVHATAVSAESEDIRADRDRSMIDASRAA